MFLKILKQYPHMFSFLSLKNNGKRECMYYYNHLTANQGKSEVRVIQVLRIHAKGNLFPPSPPYFHILFHLFDNIVFKIHP